MKILDDSSGECSQPAMFVLGIHEMQLVGGGAILDNALDGFNTGGALGSVGAAAITGSTIGATRWGLIGASLGFAAGLGWGIGVHLRQYIYQR